MERTSMNARIFSILQPSSRVTLTTIPLFDWNISGSPGISSGFSCPTSFPDASSCCISSNAFRYASVFFSMSAVSLGVYSVRVICSSSCSIKSEAENSRSKRLGSGDSSLPGCSL